MNSKKEMKKRKNIKQEIRDLDKFIKRYKRNDKSLPLGKLMYDTYKKEVKRADRDCAHQTLGWARSHFWKLVLKDDLILFHELYTKLKEGGCTKRKPYIYGDLDKYLWVEKTDDKMKVIVQQTKNSTADNYTHLFIYREPLKNDIMLSSFRIATAWEREKRTDLGGGHTYLEQPSLSTYRKTDYKLTYGDCRDPGHVLLCELWQDKIEDQYADNNIIHALWLLKWCHEELTKKKEAVK